MIDGRPRTPPEFMPSVYGNVPLKRAVELPDLVSVKVTDLFQGMSKAIYNTGDDLSVITRHTRESLKNVDMGRIRPEHTINLCLSEHGFSIMGGHAYIEMVRTIKEVVEERTGNRNIRLRVVMYRTPREAEEVEEFYHLKEMFQCEIVGCGPFDAPVEIDTYIGKLHGIKKVYDADWLIHAYYDDPREMYVHRLFNRSLKSFAMNFARYETRSLFHFNFGITSAMIVPKAIYDSEFVQGKFAFGTYLRTAPSGLIAIDSDNDLYAIDRRSMITQLRDFGLMRGLFSELEGGYVAVWDAGRWGYYMHTGGLCFGTFIAGDRDYLDLDIPYTMKAWEGRVNYEGGPLNPHMTIPPALKSIVSNQSWVGIGISYLPHVLPLYIVGEDQAELYRNDKTNPGFAQFSTVVKTIEEGVAAAREKTGCKELLLFDGSWGSVNCTRGVAEELIRKSPAVEKSVMEDLYPKYLRQRGIDPLSV